MPANPDLAARLESLAGHLPPFIQTQRWFGAKGRRIARASVVDWVELPGAEPRALVAVVALHYVDGEPDWYLLTLAEGATPDEPFDLDSSARESFARRLLHLLLQGAVVPTAAGGAFELSPGPIPLRGAPDGAVRALGAEQSNTSVLVGKSLVMKLFRRLQVGPNPDVEVLDFLAAGTDFRAVPPLYGHGEYRTPSGDRCSVVALTGFVENQGDGWSYVLNLLRRPDAEGELTYAAETLGTVTADMHLALASRSDVPDFAPASIAAADAACWRADIDGRLERVLAALREDRSALAASDAILADRVLAGAERLRQDLTALDRLAASGATKIRHHGDYHLGQVLKTADGFVVLDFEGEPARPLAERRALHTPLKDVAGMLRSFDYAAATIQREGDEQPARLAPARRDALHATFLAAYRRRAATGQASFLPAPEIADPALAALEVEKALYEVEYERHNRPAWIGIPLGFLARLCEES